MEEKTKKELRKERRKVRKAKRKEIWNDNKELIVQGGIAVLGFIGTVGGIIAVIIDHNKTRDEQNFDRAFLHDNLNDVYWYLDEPLTNEEKKEIIRRRNYDGEDIMDILEEMGKI